MNAVAGKVQIDVLKTDALVGALDTAADAQRCGRQGLLPEQEAESGRARAVQRQVQCTALIVVVQAHEAIRHQSVAVEIDVRGLQGELSTRQLYVRGGRYRNRG